MLLGLPFPHSGLVDGVYGGRLVDHVGHPSMPIGLCEQCRLGSWRGEECTSQVRFEIWREISQFKARE